MSTIARILALATAICATAAIFVLIRQDRRRAKLRRKTVYVSVAWMFVIATELCLAIWG